MSENFVGEIRIFAGSYAPYGWALCNGQSLPITGNEALYALIGTSYGSNPSSDEFYLPNMQARLPVGQGTGPGLTPRTMTQTGGELAVALLTTNMPSHTHAFNVSNETATQTQVVAGEGLGAPVSPVVRYAVPNGTPTPTPQVLAAASLTAATGGQSHSNLMPYVTLNYIIATTGVYPQNS